MNRQEYIISDFSSAVIEKEHLALASHPNCWEVVTYETEYVNGNLLLASEESWPEPVTIQPKLSGWYKIYVCLENYGGGFGGGYLKNRISLQLTDDEFPSLIKAGDLSKCRPAGFHMMQLIEEALWKCADMTGQDITISKIHDKIAHYANIYWLRFVPMNEEEVKEYLDRIQDSSRKTLFAHMDGDFHSFDNAITPHDFCKPFYAMKDSDVGIVCQEVCNDLIDYRTFDKPYAARDAFTKRRMEYFRHLSENRYTIYPVQIEYAHKCGMQLFAGHRMQLSNFAFPLTQPMFTIPFVTKHPELLIKSRDGVTGGFLSYAYPETQDFMIQNLLESAEHGFDGVLLIFNRGQHLGFEEPVAEKYREKYGDTTDFYRLPQNHPRLMELRSDIMTEFFVKVRKVLHEYAEAHSKEPMKIYLNAFYNVEDSLLEGLDLKRLITEGCLDGCIFTKKMYIEQTDDVLAPDGLIDLEKYTQKAKTSSLFNTSSDSLVSKMATGVATLHELAAQNGVELFSENQWESLQPPENYVKSAKTLYNAGKCRISLWDCYPCRVENRAEWDGTSRIGDPAYVAKMSVDAESYHKIYRVYSYNGVNIQYTNPCWRG